MADSIDMEAYAESIEDSIETKLKLFKDSMFELWDSHNREMKHLVLGTLINLIKTEKNITYKELSDSYGTLSPDTFKSLATRRVYLSNPNAEALYEWLVEEVALYYASHCFSSIVKALYPRQLTIKFGDEV